MQKSGEKWVSVYSTSLAHRAEIVKSILEEGGLNPVIVDKNDSSLKFGYYEVYVIQEEALTAANMINNGIEFNE